MNNSRGTDDGTWVDAAGARHSERRRQVHITEAQIDMIAERAARLAVQQMIETSYQAVGRGVVQKGLYVIGVVACGVVGTLYAKGWIKL